MAHRPEDQDAHESATAGSTITVRLTDMEPVLGLTAAVARLCDALTPDAVAAMSAPAVEALSVVQGVMWRLGHAQPERE